MVENVEDTRHAHTMAMLNKLKSYGLPEIYCQVVTCRMCFAWSYADIAEELGIPHRETAYEIFKEAVRLLKERNYE